MTDSPLLFEDADDHGQMIAAGDWRLDSAGEIDRRIDGLRGNKHRLDASRLEALDAAGSFLLLRAAERLSVAVENIHLAPDHQALFTAVATACRTDDEAEQAPPPFWQAWLAGIGRVVVEVGVNLRLLVGFFGLVLNRLAGTVLRPSQWRLAATAFHMQQSGLNALPLVALLSFLVGAVVAYLGATVLRDFGAELFVVDLISYSFLREFGVLLTAILLAGRTASAFAAQIGTMKSREEIDAMRTLGLDPIVLLVLPRLIALLVMLPILALLGTLAGFFGGMVVSVLALGLEPELFVHRLNESLALRHYLVGLAKAPVFALIIAPVGCLEGFKVAGTAQSVGERTTSAVVQSITLVIVIDAFAAVFFMEIGW